MSTAGDDGGGGGRVSLKEDEVAPCEAVTRATSATDGGGRRSLSSQYEGRRASSSSTAATSDLRQHRPLSVNEKEEIGLLKMENAMLRQKVLALEQQFEDYAKKDTAEHSDDLDDVNDLLRMAELAKHEAKAYSQNTSRDKMRKDIQILQAILKKAKAERSEFKKAIKLSEERLRYECEKKKEEGLKNEIDKEIFTKIIKDDRDRYRQQVMDLTDRIKRLEREKYEVFLWAKQNQENCLLEMRKLTRALIKAKKMADEQSHDSKELYELAVRVKQVLHLADITEAET